MSSVVEMAKGSNIPLEPGTDSTVPGRLQAVLSWDTPPDGATLDADISALLVTDAGRVRSDDDLIFYNQPAAADGSVRHVGKAYGDEQCTDRVDLDIAVLDPEVTRVVIAASLDGGPRSGFGALTGLALTLANAEGVPVATFPIQDASTETAFVFGEVYQRGGAWKLRAVGQGYDSGLAGLATDFGITIDDSADDSEEGDDALETASDAALGEFLAEDDFEIADEDGHLYEAREADEDATDAPRADAERDERAQAVPLRPVPTAADASTAPGAAPRPASPAVSGSAAPRRRSITTRKKKVTQAVVPALALALDDTWQAARLFSIAGVGTSDEQEKRATSALMAIVMAVRPFGRAFTARLGAPAGTLETFIEVAFKLGERTVYPDAVIRVARGARTWTCLVETKTGSGQLRQAQVEAYLDVAKAQGFDAVLTLSNDIAPSAGEHPVTVDKRKLRKVSLYHLSWAEVMHEARMQSQHRGVDDPAQAWMLTELLRYLEHPRSGAGGFTDMGAAWVPVREAVAAGTLRGTDKRALEVGASWDRLVRHLCMRLTGSLGVEVRPLLTRRLAADPAARVAATLAQLTGAGQLTAAIKVPDAVGPITVVADLRTSQVEVSVELDAPRDGRPLTRVNWLLRQLKDAPETLRIECAVARKSETTAELLKDVRVTPSELVPDGGAEIRTFRVVLTAPLGTKRGTGRGAFITSVETTLEAFYGDVVQGLRAWTPPAPKMSGDIPDVDEAADDTDATALNHEAIEGAGA